MLQTIHGSQSIHPRQVTPKSPAKRQIDPAFQSFMHEAIKKADKNSPSVTFSHHAQKRMDQHGFILNEKDMQLLEEAVETLEAKGSENSLILYDDLALIASIKNKTVITALKSTEMNEVTNIDSAIQINEKR